MKPNVIALHMEMIRRDRHDPLPGESFWDWAYRVVSNDQTRRDKLKCRHGWSLSDVCLDCGRWRLALERLTGART